jgi:hypothetical protein
LRGIDASAKELAFRQDMIAVCDFDSFAHVTDFVDESVAERDFGDVESISNTV